MRISVNDFFSVFFASISYSFCLYVIFIVWLLTEFSSFACLISVNLLRFLIYLDLCISDKINKFKLPDDLRLRFLISESIYGKSLPVSTYLSETLSVFVKDFDLVKKPSVS